MEYGTVELVNQESERRSAALEEESRAVESRPSRKEKVDFVDYVQRP